MMSPSFGVGAEVIGMGRVWSAFVQVHSTDDPAAYLQANLIIPDQYTTRSPAVYISSL